MDNLIGAIILKVMLLADLYVSQLNVETGWGDFTDGFTQGQTFGELVGVIDTMNALSEGNVKVEDVLALALAAKEEAEILADLDF